MRFVLRPSVIAALLIYLNSFGACPPRPSSECRAFYELSDEQRKERVRTASLEKQIDLYKCGMYQEPPADYASEIADGGEKVIPYLLERIKAEQSETFQDAGLLHIFEESAKKGYLRGRRDVIEQLRPIVSAITNDEIKRSAQQRLNFIERNL
jgi:hypothetical protein